MLTVPGLGGVASAGRLADVPASDGGGTGSGAPFGTPVDPPPLTAVGTSVQVQPPGQSVSAVQVVAVGAHEPGNDVVVVHIESGGDVPASLGAARSPAGGLPSVEGVGPEPLLVDALPADPVPPDPEQAPNTDGWQVNPSPQAASF